MDQLRAFERLLLWSILQFINGNLYDKWTETHDKWKVQ